MDGNELYHYGVLGMKWGVRRYQNKNGTLTASGKQKQAWRNAKAKKKSDVKNRGTLSTAQLEQKIKRLQMEKQLRQLTDEEINPGKRAVTGALASIGTKVATTAISGAALYAIKAAVTKHFDAQEMGSAIFNGGPKKK